MIQDARIARSQQSHRLRLNTLIRLRWLAIVGQSVTVIIVAYGCGFPLPVACFALIACSAWLNLFLAFRYPATHRLTPEAAFGMLTFDALQLAGLLYMTGGLTNPFSLLMTVPVVISATSLPLRMTALLGALVIAMATMLVFFHLPLPWYADERRSPCRFIYVAGMWVALTSSIAFTGIYAFRVADEARLLANALAATELVLQREQHLSALDGLAAAAAHELGTPLATIALVAKEMERTLGNDETYRRGRQAAALAERTLPRNPETPDQPVVGGRGASRPPAADLADRGGDRAAPRFRHRDQAGAGRARRRRSRSDGAIRASSTGSAIWSRTPSTSPAKASPCTGAGTTSRWRSASSTTGRDFPRRSSTASASPICRRARAPERGGGLGLGLFIAKTLLERSGATLSFRNSSGRRRRRRGGRSPGRASCSWHRRRCAEVGSRMLDTA